MNVIKSVCFHLKKGTATEKARPPVNVEIILLNAIL